MRRVVRLDRIYTGGGDRGETSLSDGTRIRKRAPRTAAIGDIDEANAAIGLARLHVGEGEAAEVLARIQNDMFDLGADVATPGDGTDDGDRPVLRISEAQVSRLEREIDAVSAGLQPLASFVLRSGNGAAAHLHHACTVARRAERSLWAVAASESVNPAALTYLNRLSDLLFVLARDANDGGAADVLWRPGLNRG